MCRGLQPYRCIAHRCTSSPAVSSSHLSSRSTVDGADRDHAHTQPTTIAQPLFIAASGKGDFARHETTHISGPSQIRLWLGTRISQLRWAAIDVALGCLLRLWAGNQRGCFLWRDWLALGWTSYIPSAFRVEIHGRCRRDVLGTNRWVERRVQRD
jgi:hypothetical protein